MCCISPNITCPELSPNMAIHSCNFRVNMTSNKQGISDNSGKISGSSRFQRYLKHLNSTERLQTDWDWDGRSKSDPVGMWLLQPTHNHAFEVSKPLDVFSWVENIEMWIECLKVKHYFADFLNWHGTISDTWCPTARLEWNLLQWMGWKFLNALASLLIWNLKENYPSPLSTNEFHKKGFWHPP